MFRSPKTLLAAEIVAAVLVVAFPVSALANAPAPVSDATLAGDTLRFCGEGTGPGCEPPETPNDLHILDEKLRFEIEGAEAGLRDHRVTVSAIYRIRNAANRTIGGRTQFVAAGAADREPHRVEFDGEPIDATIESVSVPPEWRAPTRAALPNGEEIELSPDLRGAVDKTEALALGFDLTIPPGEHRLRVSYGVWPRSNREPRPYLDERHKHAVIPYVLAPANTWRSFGELTIEVQTPPGYVLSSSLPLVSDGRRHLGTFESLPADNLTLAVQPDPSPVRALVAHRIGYWAFLWLLPIVWVLACGIVDLERWMWRRLGWSRDACPGFLLGAGYGLVGLGLGVGWLFTSLGAENLLCPYLVPEGYLSLRGIGVLLGTPLVVVVSWIVMSRRSNRYDQ